MAWVRPAGALAEPLQQTPRGESTVTAQMHAASVLCRLCPAPSTAHSWVARRRSGCRARCDARSDMRGPFPDCFASMHDLRAAGGAPSRRAADAARVQEKGKLLELRQMLAAGLKPPVLVFVSTKERAKALCRELMYEKARVDTIHADQSHAARAAAITNFRKGKTWVLITTDLLARGMDFLGVQAVVNYDFPRTKTDYIHRRAPPAPRAHLVLPEWITDRLLHRGLAAGQCVSSAAAYLALECERTAGGAECMHDRVGDSCAAGLARCRAWSYSVHRVSVHT